ncbi:phage portal protein [Methylovirgula ligni]|uniref:HK97 family phage portal protein n=1 Tax=Methylovirgula ligni TaxID=569860 RepID=A0A3D9YN06_9HYPH|nr:phage portal protein [Methylovirgula ligni]QAY96698.1 phage portal protein [Methylovirgula ligni]REF83261.1 HK97 family phage portal protein [Methylovirgula ligni]
MGFLRKFHRQVDWSEDEQLWAGSQFTSHSATGVAINQTNALSATTFYACVMMLSEDVAKLKPLLFQPRDDGGRNLVTKHWLVDLLRKPNDWQSGFEFRQMMMVQLLLRENAYAVICRTKGGRPYKLIPVNSDRVAIWEAPSGELFYRVTPLGLHEMAELRDQPFLIPAEDVFHLRGLSINGLLGSSRIVLHKDAVGLAIAQEQQQSRWMQADSNPGGILTTNARLGPGTAERIAKDWRTLHSGMSNSGKVAVLEQGLKFNKLGMSAADMDFINGRNYQRQDIALLFRIPPHMIGIVQGRSAAGVVDQQAAEYLNFTLTGHTQRFSDKADLAFNISGMGMFLDWDYSILTRADQATRYQNYQKMIAGGFGTPNEARIDDGKNPMPDGDKLWKPTNIAYAGSDVGGTAPEGAGRPSEDDVGGDED